MSFTEKLKKSKYFPIIAVVLALLIWLGQTAYEYLQKEEQPVVESTCAVHFVDVGQGDCTLVTCGGYSLLIDAGENGHESEVINYLRNQGIEKLDYVIATHQHSDHIGGMAEVLEEFEADVIIMPRLTKAQTPTNSTYTAFLKAVEASQAKVVSAKPGSVYNLGGATFEILGPVTDDAEDINNMSAVTKLTFGENTFLITGDAETEEELEILDNGADINCDVLRAGHHGSYTSSCKDWLAAATPEICVISCGEGNDYGHPHDAALKRIKKHTQEIYRTDICGDIVMVSDGKNITVDYAA